MSKPLTWSAEKIISLIPDELLDQLASETGVDYSVQKLHGKTVFKLFLFAFLDGKRISLRVMEIIFKSERFRSLFHITPTAVKHSSIGMRLQTIDYRYFERIFTYLIHSEQLEHVLFDRKKVSVSKIDTTIVTLSSKLLRFGLDDNPGYKTLKFGVTLKASVPVQVVCFPQDQKYLSEDNALPELIRATQQKRALNIAIFDRGIQRKQNFIDFQKQHIYFISRLSSQKVTVVRERPVRDGDIPTLTVTHDQMVRFSSSEGIAPEDVETELRVITGTTKDTKQEMKFLTNVDFLSATEITELYKSRWEIETFFKFIKQEMNFSHLLSRSENGIKVVMYLTMIVAILLTLYKKMNKIVGWTVAKIQFLDELFVWVRDTWHKEISTGLQQDQTVSMNSS